jgi:hypothetical protein
MIRKTIFTIMTLATVAALVTPAFAKGGKHHGKHFRHFGPSVIVTAADDDCEWRLVRTRGGNLVRAWVCD